MTGGTAHVDDAAAAGFDDFRQAGLGAVKGAVDDRGEGLAPFFRGDFQKRFDHVDHRAVDQHIDAAERLYCRIDHLPHVNWIGGITDMPDGTSALRSNGGDDFIELGTRRP